MPTPKSDPARMRKPEWHDIHGRPELVVHPDIHRRPTPYRVEEQPTPETSDPTPPEASAR